MHVPWLGKIIPGVSLAEPDQEPKSCPLMTCAPPCIWTGGPPLAFGCAQGVGLISAGHLPYCDMNHALKMPR